MSLRYTQLLVLFLWIGQLSFGQIGVEIAWLPITDAEKEQKAPRVDKTAGAEAIFWRVHVWDQVMGSDWQRHEVSYVRVKVFNEEGKKRVSSIEVPYGKDTAITSIEGRTIQPDGTIVLLKKEDIHDREVVRVGRIRRKVKSFAMPAVEPGAIVEYRIREVQFRQNMRYLRAQMQHSFPIQKMTYFVKPLGQDDTSMRMYVWPFNCKNSPLNQGTNGFSSTTVENLPAFQEEPSMIGEANVRAWILFLYMESNRRDPAKYWEKRGKEIYTTLRQALRVNDEIKQASAKAVEGKSGEEEKVVALIGYLRKNLRNLFDASVTDAERAKVIKSMPRERARTSAEIFKSGIGMPDELNTLFAAMAQAVGLEARPALVGNRDGVLFQPAMADSYFLSNIDMAVKIGGKWKIFDATTNRLPANMLEWREEGTQALVSDPKAPTFIATPLSPPGDSVSMRRGKFTLDEEGVLSGEVEYYFTGHAAADERADKRGESPEKQQELVKQMVSAAFPGAEVTGIQVENVDDTSKALAYRGQIRVSGYAQRTGKRLLFAPLFFQQGTTPRFSASERKHPIAFPYAWQEDDEIRIKVPEGFRLDNAESPGDLTFGAGEYRLKMGTLPTREFVASRKLEFGRNGGLVFDVAAYPALKRLFEEVHKRDTTVLSLKAEGQ